MLTEPVTLLRTGVVYQDTTWMFPLDARVLDSVTSQHMEQDLDRFVTQFITDYNAVNRSERFRESLPAPLAESTAPTSLAPDQNPTHQIRRLGNLHADRLSVLAGSWSSALRDAAARQLLAAGIRPSSDVADSEAIDLSLELIEHPLGDHCPGHILYGRGLYLIEEVQVARRPAVRFWSDTWVQDSIQIVSPRSRWDLETDQADLLRTLLRAYQSQ